MSQRLSELSIRLRWGVLNLRNAWVLIWWTVMALAVLVLIPKTGPALLFPAYFVLVMLLVTTLNRTISLRWVIVAFVYGCTIVPFVSLLLAWPINALFGMESGFRSTVLIPILEETLKVVPLLLFLARRRWPFRWMVGATDLMVLGAALGGGFAFYEDTLLGFIPGGVSRMTAAEFILETHGSTPHLGPLYLFPSMDVGYSNTAYIGHAAATAFIGLALGLGRLFLGRWGKAAWALPVVAWLWVIVDHGLFNQVAGTGHMSGLVKFLYTLSGLGRLSSWMFYLLLVVTAIYERLILRRYRHRTRRFALERRNLKLLHDRAQGLLGIWSQVMDLRFYLWWRRGFAYGLYIYHSRGRDDGPEGERRRYVLTVIARWVADWKARLEIRPSFVPVKSPSGFS